MKYSISEVAEIIGVAPSTIRFYDKKGLLPSIGRTEGGIRRFTEADLEWLRIIECLKTSGMALSDIQKYIHLALEGDSSIGERYEFIQSQIKSIEKQITALNEIHDILAYKSWYYKTSMEAGTVSVHENDTEADVPKKLRPVYLKLRNIVK
jgi:DNA-binding transcriptional MerR regulator